MSRDAFMLLEDSLNAIESCTKLLNHAIDNDGFPGCAIYLAARLEEHVADLREAFNEGIIVAKAG